MWKNLGVLMRQNNYFQGSEQTVLRLGLVFLLMMLNFSVWAINSDQWLVEHIETEDGLPNSTVYSLAQDQTGFMWFGTTNGLARYDGYGIKVFKHDAVDTNTISNNNAGNLFIDSNNILWIGTFGGGVNSFDLNTGVITRYPYSNKPQPDMVAENVQTFFEDSQGRIWVGTATGLYQLKNQQLQYYGYDETVSNSLSHPRVWSVVSDGHKGVWVGTSNGLNHLDPDTGTIEHYQLPESLVVDVSSNQFRSLYLSDDHSHLWIGSSSGLYVFNTSSQTFDSYVMNDFNIKINDIFAVEDDYILLASMDGLLAFNTTEHVFVYKNENTLWQQFSHFDIRQIFVDQSHLLWLATRDNGVLKINQKGGLFQLHDDFLMLKQQSSERTKQIWALEADQKGAIYLGTSDSVLKKSAQSDIQCLLTNEVDKVPGIIRDIKRVVGEGLWIAGSEGLFYLPNGASKVQFISEPFQLAGIEPTDVFSVEVTASGTLWMALYNVGILRWDPALNESKLMRNYLGGSLTDVNLTHVFQDSFNDIWISSNLVGVFRYHPDSESMHLYNNKISGSAKNIPSNRVKDVYEDSHGRLWLATERGLAQYNRNNDSFKTYTKADGLLQDSVISLFEDSKQNLWLGHAFGITRFNPESNEIKSYVLNDSIKKEGMITRSVTVDENDVMYFGSVNGYYTFDPRDLKHDVIYEPSLVLTDIRINDTPMSFKDILTHQQQFELSHQDRNIGLKFAVLDFQAPEMINYRYRVLGLHSDWLDVSMTRHIELTRLNPGAYTLEIKAINSDGRWDEVMLNIPLFVQPAWWDRSWVKFLMVLTVLLVVWALHYYRTVKIRNINQVLEAEVLKRTQELNELNKQLKSAAHTDFLTGLPNRMAFIQQYEQKRHRHDDTVKSCIVVADIDHFKLINDHYGHAAGDEVLKQVSQIIRSQLRNEDLVARWGGEEFIFYFENKDLKETAQLIERLRQQLQETKISYENFDIYVTFTFGICQVKSGMNLKTCTTKADEAMYRGKQQGRNQVSLADA